MKIATWATSAALLAIMAAPASAESLSRKDMARGSRAAPEDREEVRDCLIKRKQGARKGMLIGAVGGAGVSAVAGGNLGKSLLAGAVGAVAGNLIGKGQAGGRACDEVLEQNP